MSGLRDLVRQYIALSDEWWQLARLSDDMRKRGSLSDYHLALAAERRSVAEIVKIFESLRQAVSDD